MAFIEKAEFTRQGERISVRLDLEIAQLVASEAPQIVIEMVRKQAVAILMADKQLQDKIHQLALDFLIGLAEKVVPADPPKSG